MDPTHVVLVSNPSILEQMPPTVAVPVSKDTAAGMLFEVFDYDQFVEWCSDSTTWIVLHPESED